MALTRVEKWDTVAFQEFLLARADVPFAWGANDCSIFTADGVLAITGTDIASDFRGKYESEETAIALVKKVTGGADVEAAAAWCAEKVGMQERLHPMMAQRGEMVLVQSGDRVIAGLVHLSGRHVVTVAEAGLVRLPITAVKRAWSY